ncbi:unnamed protein product [Heligmosomoides polygyrus]|uniref:DDE_3 domain-containing protein n=1 Tax=Heligmosomoides polygyrus TaxID=6339 RepID=A0A183GW51_HELPZ|nr:unnamed protein product [Heligmosomoides polygyrus]
MAHFLTSQVENIRLKRSRRLVERSADDTHRSIVFSDQKIFTIGPTVNLKNNRILAEDKKQAISRGKVTGKTPHPSSVMVWGAVTSDGRTPSVFVDAGVKINKEVYLKLVLKKVLKPWSTSHFGDKPWCFQQCSAPAHKASVAHQWCQRELPHFIDHEE